MRFYILCFFVSSRRRHTRSYGDWSSDVCSSDLPGPAARLLPCDSGVRHAAFSPSRWPRSAWCWPGSRPVSAPRWPTSSPPRLARKDCFGTARNGTSKVWYTVAGGVLSDVYSPTIDTTNVETLQYVVTDGRTFTDLQSRDTTYTVRATDPSGMACQVTSTAKNGRYRLVSDYVTDPDRNAVLISTRLLQASGPGVPAGLQVYVRYDASINGNGGRGPANGGADDAVVDQATTALVSSDLNTVTNAANRDYAVPLYGALRATRPFLTASSGYAGTASDGLTQLDADHALATTYVAAPHGNVVQTGRLNLGDEGAFTLALGFGTSASDAIGVAGRSAHAPSGQTASRYVASWRAYDKGL